MNSVVIRASRVVIVSRRVVRDELLSKKMFDEDSVESSMMGGSVLISLAGEYGCPLY